MKVNNRIDTGESHIQNTFGHNFKIKPFTGEQWNIRKEPLKPLTKPAVSQSRSFSQRFLFSEFYKKNYAKKLIHVVSIGCC